MPFVIFGILVLLLALLPGLWVQSVMRRYREPANRYPRTGGQTARHYSTRAACATSRPK